VERRDRDGRCADRQTTYKPEGWWKHEPLRLIVRRVPFSAAKALRHILFCVAARIVRTGRRTILRLPAGFLHADTFTATYNPALALGP
jgi:hypothetical protein